MSLMRRGRVPDRLKRRLADVRIAMPDRLKRRLADVRIASSRLARMRW